MKWNRKHDANDEDADDKDHADDDRDEDDLDDDDRDYRRDYQQFDNPRPPFRVGRQARETILMCLLAALIAALVWGIYKWTGASHWTPPVYSNSTNGDQ